MSSRLSVDKDPSVDIGSQSPWKGEPTCGKKQPDLSNVRPFLLPVNAGYRALDALLQFDLNTQIRRPKFAFPSMAVVVVVTVRRGFCMKFDWTTYTAALSLCCAVATKGPKTDVQRRTVIVNCVAVAEAKYQEPIARPRTIVSERARARLPQISGQR